jgi:hypothetical protein
MSNLERAIADRYAKLTGDPNNDIQPVSKEALIGVIEQMTVPQPFQYQGSKRALAPLILQYLPISTPRLVEPFCGSAAEARRRNLFCHVPSGGHLAKRSAAPVQTGA